MKSINKSSTLSKSKWTDPSYPSRIRSRQINGRDSPWNLNFVGVLLERGMFGSKNSAEHGAEERKTVFWPQWMAALVICLAVIVSGLANGWASPYLAQLTTTVSTADTSLSLTDDEASWIASLLNLGRLFGAVIGAICQGRCGSTMLSLPNIFNTISLMLEICWRRGDISEYTGRKRTLLLGGIPLASSWIFIACATSVDWLYASRFCSGIGSGIIWPALSLYLAEIADPVIRGSLISANVNAASIGMFFGNAMGSYLSMEIFAYVSLVPNILFMVLFSLIPESPYHYAVQNNTEKAQESLKWFRRHRGEADLKAEMQELRDFVDGARPINGKNILSKLKELQFATNIKKILSMFLLNVFVYMTGYNAINAYAEIIVIKCKVGLTPSIIVMAMGFSTIVAGSMAVFTVDRYGRRMLLTVSCIGVAASLGLLGLHFHLLSVNFDPHSLSWLPIISLLTFNVFISYGIMPVPSSLMGELFPANLKNLASFILSAGNALLSFASTRSYQPYLDLVGEKFLFWTYAIVSLVAVPYVYVAVPETKGKSLLEIQKPVSNGNVSKSRANA